ncbi:exo-alpha-sialidase, partial [Trypanosoma cruzi]
HQRNGRTLLRLTVDGHRRHKSEVVVRKVVQLVLPLTANRPLRPRSRELHTALMQCCLITPIIVLHCGVHPEVLVPPCAIREVAGQKANQPIRELNSRAAGSVR